MLLNKIVKKINESFFVEAEMIPREEHLWIAKERYRI